MFEGVQVVERKTHNKIPWKGVSNYIFAKTDRRFGAKNVHKMYDAKTKEMEAAVKRLYPPRVPPTLLAHSGYLHHATFTLNMSNATLSHSIVNKTPATYPTHVTEVLLSYQEVVSCKTSD